MVAPLNKTEAGNNSPPCERSFSDSVPNREMSPESSAPQAKEPMISQSRIVIVDDCDTSRKIIARKLSNDGYEIIEFTSGIEALTKVPEIEPDLVLMEISMDGLDGLVVCESLKQMSHLANVPIIFLTKLADKKNVVRGLQSGAADYIIKPFDTEEAIARINTHLKIRQLNLETIRVNKELIQANKAKDKMLRVTTHDLKNPLNSIRGIMDFMMQGEGGPISEEQKEMITHVGHAAESMIELVEDLLDQAAIDAGALVLNKGLDDFSNLANEVVALNQSNAKEKEIRIRFQNQATATHLTYDKRQIRRVLQNLISNAIKFSTANTTVKVKLGQTQNEVYIFVDDEGPGVPPEEQGRLFTEFGQTSVSATAGESSTGLGLSICKKIIEAHQGKIWMQNLEQKGARFAFSLPFNKN